VGVRVRGALWFAIAVCLAATAAAPVARAGPPFVTDDPEPVGYREFEIYLASQLEHIPEGWSGTAPQLEVNYGPLPNLQISATIPLAFSAPQHGTTHFGYGDTELGVKYRFVQEGDVLPQIAFFPRVDLPSGNDSRGLGAGHVQAILPIWLQKSWGDPGRAWTAYGGGGYWIHPGSGNRDWWYAGGVLQRQLTDRVSLGAELFHGTPSEVHARGSTWLNFGGKLALSKNYQLLASAGHNVTGSSGFQAYVALEITFGLH
jgi:hypothetical protein